jgi:hypothetical protein
MPFNAANSTITEQSKMAFLRTPWSAPLKKVPGIGPATQRVLRDHGITTMYQLIALFLSLRSEGITEADWCQAMWDRLTEMGCKSGHRAGIIDSLGDKLALIFPGIYTPLDPSFKEGGDDVDDLELDEQASVEEAEADAVRSAVPATTVRGTVDEVLAASMGL